MVSENEDGCDKNCIAVIVNFLNITGTVSRHRLWKLVNTEADDGLLPLHLASLQGKAKVVDALLQFGVDVNVLDGKSKEPALIWAAKGGNVRVLEVLLSHGANMTWSDKEGTALNWATKDRHTDAVVWLLNQGLSLETRDGFHMTPLQTASYNGDKTEAEILLQHSADIESFDNYWWTPMFWATANGHLDVVQLLLNHSAEVNVRDKSGMTPLHEAAGDHSVNGTGDHVEVLQLLLDHAAVVQAQSNSGLTSLHAAVTGNRIPAVKLLLKYGADVNTPTYNGFTALHMAASSGFLDMAKTLLDNSASVNARDDDGRTPLFIAMADDMKALITANGGTL